LRQAQIQLLEQQLVNHGQLMELAGLERELAADKAAYLEAELETLRAAAARKRREAAGTGIAAAEAARTKLGTLPESVRPAAERIVEANIQFRAELNELVRKEAEVNQRLRSIEQDATRVTSEFDAASRRIES